MRVFTASLATETNTFAPMPTRLSSFRERGWDLIEGRVAAAQPSGSTTRVAYEALRDELLSNQVLPDTLGLGPEVWRVLGKSHELRNRSGYESDQSMDQRLVTDLLAACARVATKVQTLPTPAP